MLADIWDRLTEFQKQVVYEYAANSVGKYYDTMAETITESFLHDEVKQQALSSDVLILAEYDLVSNRQYLAELLPTAKWSWLKFSNWRWTQSTDEYRLDKTSEVKGYRLDNITDLLAEMIRKEGLGEHAALRNLFTLLIIQHSQLKPVIDSDTLQQIPATPIIFDFNTDEDIDDMMKTVSAALQILNFPLSTIEKLEHATYKEKRALLKEIHETLLNNNLYEAFQLLISNNTARRALGKLTAEDVVSVLERDDIPLVFPYIYCTFGTNITAENVFNYIYDKQKLEEIVERITQDANLRGKQSPYLGL